MILVNGAEHREILRKANATPPSGTAVTIPPAVPKLEQVPPASPKKHLVRVSYGLRMNPFAVAKAKTFVPLSQVRPRDMNTDPRGYTRADEIRVKLAPAKRALVRVARAK